MQTVTRSAEPNVNGGPPLPSAARATRAALRGELPEHYAGTWRDAFDARVQERVRPGMRILDVGAGSYPALPPERRPEGCHYVGLDISESELRRAPAGFYDDWVVADAREHVPALEDRFDLALSFQVLEHVKPLADVVENMRTYLVPGGHFLAQLSGSFSVFGLANQVIPHRASVWLLTHLLHRPAETVFPAHYDHCWYNALERMLSGWSSAEVIPHWRGALYFQFSRVLQAGYLGYEEWTRLAEHRNLAPYYLLDAVH